jgi:hypothetical protein
MIIYRKLLPKLKNRDAMFDVWLHQLVAYKEAMKFAPIIDFETESELFDWR